MEWWVKITRWFKYIIKKHEILTTISPIHVYINKNNNWLVFKTKYGYKLTLQMPETYKKINKQNKRRKKRTKSWSSWSGFSLM